MYLLRKRGIVVPLPWTEVLLVPTLKPLPLSFGKPPEPVYCIAACLPEAVNTWRISYPDRALPHTSPSWGDRMLGAVSTWLCHGVDTFSALLDSSERNPLVTSGSLQWRHNGPDSVSNHQPHDCLLNRLFRRRSKKTSKLRVTGLCAGNSPGTGEFPAQMASNAENASIWWRHHVPLRDGHQNSELGCILVVG